MTKIAIQGLLGSFHHIAAEQLLAGHHIEPVECVAFTDVFHAVLDGETEYGVVAIENSLHGSINAVYRLLDRHDVWIAGETSLAIEQYLISYADTPLDQLNHADTQVLSQAPALAQVELWLDKHLPLATRRETHDTAESVRYVVAQQNPRMIAIAGERAVGLYNGHIIAGPINDDPHNYTRFVLLHKKHDEPADSNRTSIIMRTDHKPGSLLKALQAFADAGINLSKLDSHPIPGDSRHYSYYVDFDVGVSSDQAQSALDTLKVHNVRVKILGSYRV